MDPFSAAGAYGVQRGAYASNAPATISGVDTSPTGNAVGALNVTHHQLIGGPLFWLLVFVLVFVGYLSFLFDFSLKRIGEVKVKAG